MLKRILNAAILFVLIAFTTYLAFYYAPLEKSMGVIQKIFYLHVSSAFSSFVALGICCYANLMYVFKRQSKWDWLGVAAEKQGQTRAARKHWQDAARFKGDFQEMRVRIFSEMTYYSALGSRRLGHEAAARDLLRQLLAYARDLFRQPARIDYFATSLPTMLLFDDDLDFRQQTTALFLEAQARLGFGELEAGRKLVAQVLERDPNHPLAADLQVDAAAASGRSADILVRSKPRAECASRNANGYVIGVQH